MKQLIFSFLGRRRRRRRKKIFFPRPSVRVPGNLRLGDDGLSLFDLQHVSNHQFSYPFFFFLFLFSVFGKRKKMGCVSACIDYRRRKKDERVMWRIVGGLSGACRPCQLSFCRQVFSFLLFFHVG